MLRTRSVEGRTGDEGSAAEDGYDDRRQRAGCAGGKQTTSHSFSCAEKERERDKIVERERGRAKREGESERQ